MSKNKKKDVKEIRRVSRCRCGLRIRGKNHEEGPHHQAWENHSTNAVRKYGRGN